jgi:hypothetical protein
MTTKSFSLSGREFLAVKLPEGAKLRTLESFKSTEGDSIVYKLAEDLPDWDYRPLRLHPGSWEIIIPDCSKASESDAGKVVEQWLSVSNDGTIIFDNYLKDIPKCRTALESLRSLFEREDMTGEGWCLMEKIS